MAAKPQNLHLLLLFILGYSPHREIQAPSCEVGRAGLHSLFGFGLVILVYNRVIPHKSLKHAFPEYSAHFINNVGWYLV